MFGPDDLKVFVEVATPIAAGVWYLRGVLVKIELTMTSLGERLVKVETSPALEDHSKRIRRLELVNALRHSKETRHEPSA